MITLLLALQRKRKYILPFFSYTTWKLKRKSDFSYPDYNQQKREMLSSDPSGFCNGYKTRLDEISKILYC